MKLTALQIGIALCLSGCASSAGAPQSVPAGGQGALRCQPGERRACPCVSGGNGVQVCGESGLAFGMCSACRAAMVTTAGVGGTAAGAPALDAGMSVLASGAGGNAGRDAGTAGAGADAGAAKDAAADSGADAATATHEPGTPEQLPASKGVSCGVGLPVQCDPQTEKCCKRSLSIDSCIPTAMTCACDVGDCTVIDVRCDGSEDCAQGQLCCATGGGSARGGSSQAYTGFACAASCTSPQRQACHAKAECPAQLTCAISQVLASISVCTDPKSLEQ